MTYGEICPYDQKKSFLCRYRECTTLCSWRYDVDGRGGRPIVGKSTKPKPCDVEIRVIVRVRVGQTTLDVWV